MCFKSNTYTKKTFEECIKKYMKLYKSHKTSSEYIIHTKKTVKIPLLQVVETINWI